MDKNPNKVTGDYEPVKKKFMEKPLNTILCSAPFVKAAVLTKLIKTVDWPVLYLDLDLLYSGYVTSGMISLEDNVRLFCPTRENWNQILKEVLERTSKERCFIILDSLNGLYNLFSQKDDGRLVNSFVMLLVSVAIQSNSNVVISGIAKQIEKEGWVLIPIGRHLIEIKEMTKIYLSTQDSDITIDFLDEKNSKIKSLVVKN